ncbi:MAG TPA: SDR family oxidoreductase [Myxococcota bacterium]|nr:SDR family oxidoreductase [Myxococcota bacterium]
MKRLEGRVAVVTGAGRGIGRGVARRLAREGAAVVVAELDPESGARCAKELRDELGAKVLYLRTDVGRKEDVLAMIERSVAVLGSVDVLVNNAWGGGTTERLERKTDAMMEHGFRVGLMSAFWAMQAAFPHMRARRWGRIVNVCSLNGVNAHMYTVEYNTAKEALRTLTRTAAREWARHGICANAICPAAVSVQYEAFRAANPELAARLTAQNPMGRMGDPEEDIAPVVAFLASDDARYVTGNTIHADGGGHINGVAWAPELPD